jgi:hypothetical protein
VRRWKDAASSSLVLTVTSLAFGTLLHSIIADIHRHAVTVTVSTHQETFSLCIN